MPFPEGVTPFTIGAKTAPAACAVACELATGQNVDSQGSDNEAQLTSSAAAIRIRAPPSIRTNLIVGSDNGLPIVSMGVLQHFPSMREVGG
jgi:hypothetical protein